MDFTKRRLHKFSYYYCFSQIAKCLIQQFAFAIYKMNVIQAAPARGQRAFMRGRIPAIPNAQRAVNIFPKYRKCYYIVQKEINVSNINLKI